MIFRSSKQGKIFRQYINLANLECRSSEWLGLGKDGQELTSEQYLALEESESSYLT